MWFQLAIKELTNLEANNAAYIELMVTGSAQRNIFLMCYDASVRAKEIPSIEQQDDEFKREIWERAKAVANGRCDHPTLIELSKALYCIQCFLK